MKYANRNISSDVIPHEVVHMIGDSCAVIRPMISRLKSTWLPKFNDHHCCTNHSDQDLQKWDIESDPDAPMFRIYLNNGVWDSGRYTMSDEPLRFINFSF